MRNIRTWLIGVIVLLPLIHVSCSRQSSFPAEQLVGVWDFVRADVCEYVEGAEVPIKQNIQGYYIQFEDLYGNGVLNNGFRSFYFVSKQDGSEHRLTIRNAPWLEDKKVTITSLRGDEMSVLVKGNYYTASYKLKKRKP